MNDLIIMKTPRIEKKPSSLRYYQDGPPVRVEPKEWKLCLSLIRGEKSFYLTLDDIKSIPKRVENRRMVCVCNWSIRRTWGGIYLKDLFNYIGLIRDDYAGLFLKQISIGTPEKGKYDSTIRIDDAISRNTMLIYEVDGEPLPLEQGYPLRLIDFGLYGYKGVKGLGELQISTEFELGYWEQCAGYALEGKVKPKKYFIVDLKTHHFIEAAEVVDF